MTTAKILKKLSAAAMLAGVTLFFSSCATPVAVSETEARPILASMTNWLALVDTLDFQRAWQSAGETFRGNVPADEFAAVVGFDYRMLGRVTGRQLADFSRTGDHDWEAKFVTRYENADFPVVETLRWGVEKTGRPACVSYVRTRGE